MTLKSSWPEAGDFVFRKRRKTGRRGRRGSRVAAKEHSKLKRHVKEILGAPFKRVAHEPEGTAFSSPTFLRAPRVPSPMLRRTYRGVAVSADPFKGKTCPGCDRTFGADYPPISFDLKDKDFGHLSGYCIRCVQHPETIPVKRRRWDAAIPITDPAFARYVSKLRRQQYK